MTLNIDTFSNQSGGFSFFKAVGHPFVMDQARRMIADIAAAGPVGIYDPHGFANAFAELHDCSAWKVAASFVQDLSDIGETILGVPAAPITDVAGAKLKTVFVMAFDAERLIDHIRYLVPDGVEVRSLDGMRLDDAMLTNRRRYLEPLNFATNFAFFRDAAGHHTRLVTANYWAGYGGRETTIWFCLFDDDGQELARWNEPLSSTVGTISIDSAEVRARFNLDDFTGQLFLHVVNSAGHDVVKYALDTYGDDPSVLSCTHDANAWPADFYAGLPAPKSGEKVVLWIQNSHPCAIPSNSITMQRMGGTECGSLQTEVPAFGSYPLDVSSLLPGLEWPAQIEIAAGKHFVRPRYEVIAANGRQRMAHANVERIDLKPDRRIPELDNLLGKSYLLPAPIMPIDQFRSIALPTPMATTQATLPVAAIVYNRNGQEIARHPFGCLPRDHAAALDAGGLINGAGARGGFPDGYGHMELVYDFSEGGEADGWLHGLFRYEALQSGHAAETSFGAHIFNTVLTYRNEPQSYTGPAPGISTRLFLRLGPPRLDSFCHLIYAASTPWHAESDTSLILHDADGTEIATQSLRIPCSGSVHWRYSEGFDDATRRRAGPNGYIVIRDVTCRLFGYHGLINDEGGFSLDHMFGF